MEREDRYIVIKRSDAGRYLDDRDIHDLNEIANLVEGGRTSDGKHPMECVVVECDWPEYEHVWDMIADRVDGASLIPTHSGWWWYVDPDKNIHCVRVDRQNEGLVAKIPDVPTHAILRIPVDALQGEWHGEAKFPIVK